MMPGSSFETFFMTSDVSFQGFDMPHDIGQSDSLLPDDSKNVFQNYDQEVVDYQDYHSDLNDPTYDVSQSSHDMPSPNETLEKFKMQPHSGGMFQTFAGGSPTKDEFPGIYNFSFLLGMPSSKSRGYMYSQMLDKVFIDIEQQLPIRFKWVSNGENLWIRTMMVFDEDQYRNDPVVRCPNHKDRKWPSNANVEDHILKHVIRCSHPHSAYFDENGWLSVYTPLGLPQAGCDYVPLEFQLYCKNSCASGMRRRATQIVFTLETARREVLGRRVLSCRVCSCPKRDKEKEETESVSPHRNERAKRKVIDRQSPMLVPYRKKLCVPNADSDYEITLTIPGTENAKAVLKYAYDLLAGEGLRNQKFSRMQPYLEKIDSKMASLI